MSEPKTHAVKADLSHDSWLTYCGRVRARSVSRLYPTLTCLRCLAAIEKQRARIAQSEATFEAHYPGGVAAYREALRTAMLD